MKKSRKLLVSSFLMIVTCCLLFAGTTFAWFSDSVSSNNNVITAGNLDVEVEYTLDGKTWADLDGAEDMFQKSLWEPGHTEVAVLKVNNVGSLALKYSAQLKIVEELIGKTKEGKDIKLSDYLNIKKLTFAEAGVDPIFGNIAERAIEAAFAKENGIAYGEAAKFSNVNELEAEKHLLAGETHYIAIQIDMPETIGNEANHDGVNVPSVSIAIDVVATQFNYEQDSFGPDYDANAPYPVIATKVSDAASLKDELADGGSVVFTDNIGSNSGQIMVNGGSLDGAGKEFAVTVKGSTDAAISVTGGTIKNVNVTHANHSTMGVGIGLNPYSSDKLSEDLVIEGVSVFYSDDIFDRAIMYAIYAEAINSPNVVISDSALYGAVDLPGAGSFTATNTTFGSGQYWYLAVSGDASFTNCTFETTYCILAYEAAAGETISFTNCYVGNTKLTAENFKTLLVSTAWDYSTELCSANLKDCTIIIDGVQVQW